MKHTAKFSFYVTHVQNIFEVKEQYIVFCCNGFFSSLLISMYTETVI
jgi:hypothetical protein